MAPTFAATGEATGPSGTVVMPVVPAAAAGASVASGAEAPTVELATAPAEPPASGVLYDEERPKRPWGKYAVIALVVLVGIGLLSYAGWLLLRTKSFEVPDLTGVEESVALNEVAGNGWVIVTERERSDEVPEIDHVVRTVPVAGRDARRG